jgi:hypothetical protein
MSSNPSESAAVALPADPAELPADSAPDSFEIRQRSWLKRLLPQGMFGRSLLLIVMPLVLVQIIAVWVFYARHWETVSKRLSLDVAGDIGLVIEAMKFTHTELELAGLLENASALTNIDFVLERGGSLTPEAPEGSSLFEEQLRDTLRERGRAGGRCAEEAALHLHDIHLHAVDDRLVPGAAVGRGFVPAQPGQVVAAFGRRCGGFRQGPAGTVQQGGGSARSPSGGGRLHSDA